MASIKLDQDASQDVETKKAGLEKLPSEIAALVAGCMDEWNQEFEPDPQASQKVHPFRRKR